MRLRRRSLRELGRPDPGRPRRPRRAGGAGPRSAGSSPSSTVSERPIRVAALLEREQHVLGLDGHGLLGDLRRSPKGCRRGRRRPSSRTAGTTGAPRAGPSARAGPARDRARGRSRGTTRNSVSSKTDMSARTSSSGCGCVDRSCPVRQRMSISSSSRRIASLRSVDEARGLRAARAGSPTRRIAVTTARRRASVGCAVNTGCTSSSRSASAEADGCPSLLRAPPHGRGQRLGQRLGSAGRARAARGPGDALRPGSPGGSST